MLILRLPDPLRSRRYEATILTMSRAAATETTCRLREWREREGLSAREVADLTGCDKGTISRLERGQRYASPRMRVQIARRLGADVSDLFAVEPLPKEELEPQ